MNDEQINTQLAVLAMGWRLAPGRYLKSDGGWVPRSRFRPLIDIRDAFRVLEALTDDYTLLALPARGFTAEVRVDGRIGRATERDEARAISIAVGRAIGIIQPESQPFASLKRTTLPDVGGR